MSSTHNLYLNGAVLNGTEANFPTYTNITMKTDYTPASNNSLTNKKYVDDAIATTGILGANNTFSEKNTFSKQLILPETFTYVTVTSSELTVNCDNASSGIFNLDFTTIISPTTISKLTITNALIGGQYVIYINNNTTNELTINGRTPGSSLYVNINTLDNVGKLNYPVAILLKPGTEFSNAILSFTYDGSNAYVACSAYA